MKFKNYTIPEGTEVEIVNKNSRFFRRRGKLEAEEPGDLGCNVWFEDDEYDVFCYYEFLPVQNIITLDKLEAKKLVQIFDANYLYETNRVVVYIGNFTTEDIEKEYKNIAAQLAKGEPICEKIEYVLALLNSMRGYDEEKFETPIGEMITFVQWWVEGLRNHVTKDVKGRRYFETECFQIDFISLD